MSLLVLDASVTLAWCFPDEDPSYAVFTRNAARESELIAPSLWPFEVANGLLVAERKRRLKPGDAGRFLGLLDALDVDVELASTAIAAACVAIARNHSLSVYDASYLELAVRRKSRLATLDGALAKAARNTGVLLAPL
ncbi:MAG TPA: type II toxin-antitoxin system VapC family toxin [Bryobacteraceae bacterium]|nr:type II toxin-antitoxin system VapC family toxin [Bryobacteraceae bacterium]